MVDRRFDALTRAVASGVSRRNLLKGLLGGTALGGAAASRVEEAAANHCPDPLFPDFSVHCGEFCCFDGDPQCCDSARGLCCPGSPFICCGEFCCEGPSEVCCGAICCDSVTAGGPGCCGDACCDATTTTTTEPPCANDGDPCAGGEGYCAGGACEPRLGNGERCSIDYQCFNPPCITPVAGGPQFCSCAPPAAACDQHLDCCASVELPANCENGTCGGVTTTEAPSTTTEAPPTTTAPPCAIDGDRCDGGEGYCEGGECFPLGGNANPCTFDYQCFSTVCITAVPGGPQFCTCAPEGAACDEDGDCCGTGIVFCVSGTCGGTPTTTIAPTTTTEGPAITTTEAPTTTTAAPTTTTDAPTTTAAPTTTTEAPAATTTTEAPTTTTEVPATTTSTTTTLDPGSCGVPGDSCGLIVNGTTIAFSSPQLDCCDGLVCCEYDEGLFCAECCDDGDCHKGSICCAGACREIECCIDDILTGLDPNRRCPHGCTCFEGLCVDQDQRRCRECGHDEDCPHNDCCCRDGTCSEHCCETTTGCDDDTDCPHGKCCCHDGSCSEHCCKKPDKPDKPAPKSLAGVVTVAALPSTGAGDQQEGLGIIGAAALGAAAAYLAGKKLREEETPAPIEEE